MAFIPCTSVAQVTVDMRHLGNVAQNVFTVKQGADWTEAQLTQLATTVRGWWEGQTRAERGGGTCLERVCVRDLTVPSGLGLCVAHGLLNCGTDTQADMPGNVTLTVSAISGFTGRSRRGRSYWVGLTEGMITGDVVNAGRVTDIVTDMEELRTAIIAQGWQLVVASFFQGTSCFPATCKKVATGRPFCETTPITGFTSDGIVDSQRRRLQGRGA